MNEIIQQAIQDLQALDYGFLAEADDQETEALLAYLEQTLDNLAEEGFWFPEGDLAIRYFLTDPEKSRSYLYGPTDIGDGIGLIEKLKAELEEPGWLY